MPPTDMKNKGLFIFAALLILVGCEQAYIPSYEEKAPSISDFSPKQGEIGTQITITGENLQRVDSVYIGGTLAAIAYRVSDKKLIAKVIGGNRTGKIRVRNVVGDAISTDNFTVQYAIPAISKYPEEGTVNAEVVVEGNNLHFVEQVLVDGKAVVIVAQRKEELVFKVPYLDKETKVSLRFTYFDGENMQSIGPEGNAFLILKEAPAVTFCPPSLTKYQPVTMQGEHFALIEKMYVGSQPVLIKLQSDEEITFDMPTNYFGGNMTGDLKGIYYGVKEIILAKDFQVFADPKEPRYYKYEDVLLSARANYGGMEISFFDAESGTPISSCDAAANIPIIDFYLYDQAGYVQLYGPQNGASTVKNFKCDGKTIDPQDGTWSSFYGEGGTTTCFRVLKPENEAEKAIIDAYEAGTIIELNDAFFSEVNDPQSKAPRVYRSSTDQGYTNSHFSLDAYPYGWIKNFTTGKSGIIKMKTIPKEAVNGRIPELTFDIIWSK